MLADQGYDSPGLRCYIAERGITLVIPGRSHRKVAVEYDHHRYGERHLAVCLIGRVNRYRRVFTRLEKLNTTARHRTAQSKCG